MAKKQIRTQCCNKPILFPLFLIHTHNFTLTLGVTKSKLARILKHLVYDGVYADVEERIAGGGCLELKKHVIKELGLNSNSISGN